VSSPTAEAGARTLDPERDPADRSILIGIAATVVIHLLVVIFAPEFSFDKFSGVHSGISVNNTNRGKTFDFELAPSAVQQPEKKPFQYVETNPDAPANEPDKTDNFSNRNQQTAQPTPAKEKDPLNRPSVEGQDKIKSDAIVTGDMSKPQLGAAARPESNQQDQADQKEQKVRMEQNPDNGFDKTKGESEEGIATNVSKTKAPTTHADEAVEGVREGKEREGGLVATINASKPQPKARPRLTSALPSVVTTRTSGSTNAGILGRDARWSEYGEYLNEITEIIVQQWYRINEESAVTPPHGSHVTITFKINSKGETDIVKVEDSEAGKQGVWSCQSAIQARQPYRKWTEQMITVLGDEQTLVFGFYYY
jgi:hypothetical protein